MLHIFLSIDQSHYVRFSQGQVFNDAAVAVKEKCMGMMSKSMSNDDPGFEHIGQSLCVLHSPSVMDQAPFLTTAVLAQCMKHLWQPENTCSLIELSEIREGFNVLHLMLCFFLNVMEGFNNLNAKIWLNQ